MIELAIILYLSYAIYRRDWSLYEFDEPIIMWVEPKDKYEAPTYYIYIDGHIIDWI